MKPFSSLVPILAVAAAGVLACPAGFAAPPQSLAFTIDDYQNLVTVKGADGSLLFSRTIPSPSIKIALVRLGRKSSRLSVQDASGKTLWSQSFSRPAAEVDVKGGWARNSEVSLNTVLNGLNPKELARLAPPLLQRVETVIGLEDQMTSFRVATQDKDGRHSLSAVLGKDGFVARMDGRVLPATRPQPPPAGAVAPPR